MGGQFFQVGQRVFGKDEKLHNHSIKTTVLI